METQVCQKRKSTRAASQANSLLLPQHRRRHHRRLMEDAIPSRPPHGDLSSQEEVGELRSPEKRSGCQTSGPPCKRMIPRSDSPPSSSGTRTAAPTSSSLRAPLLTRRTCVETTPRKLALGSLGPCTACPQP